MYDKIYYKLKKKKKQLLVLRPLWAICSKWLIQFSIIGTWLKSVLWTLPEKHTKGWNDGCSFVHSKTTGEEVSLCRPSWSWWTTRPTGTQTNPGCPVWAERRWRRDGGGLARLHTARELEEGMPPTPEIPGASALGGSPTLRGPEVTRASAYSTVCVSSAEVRGVTEAGVEMAFLRHQRSPFHLNPKAWKPLTTVKIYNGNISTDTGPASQEPPSCSNNGQLLPHQYLCLSPLF